MDNATRVHKDWKLIRQYVEDDSQAAFADLVGRYVNLVYSVCLRETASVQMAEDAAQAVFLVLARKANSFRPGIVLSTWLFDVCRLTCRNAMREQRRRTAVEREVAQEMATKEYAEAATWRDVEPHLHDALTALKSHEREMILLRFFEDLTLQEIGLTLGLSEDAVRMRVNRAVEKLRKRLTREGVSVACATLAAVLTAHSVEAAPAAFTLTVLGGMPGAAVGAAVGASVHSLAQGVLKAMSLLKWQTIGIAVLGSAATVGIITGAAHWPGHSFRGVAAGASGNASSSGTVPAESDPKAIALMQQMADTYAALKSYSDIEIGESTVPSGDPERVATNYRRPGQFDVEVTQNNRTTRVVADSKYVYSISVPGGLSYVRQLRESQIKSWHSNMAVPRIAHLQGQFSLVSMLLESSADYMKGILQTSVKKDKSSAISSVIYLGDAENVGSILCDTLQTASTVGMYQSFSTMSIGRDDHLLRRIRMHIPATGQMPASDNTITITGVQANTAIPDSIFRFDPPPGSKSIDIGLHNDPKAQAVIQAMYDAYDALDSFSCSEDITLTPSKYFGERIDGPWPLNRITYVIRKPFEVAFDIQGANKPDTGDLKVVSDGNTAYVQGTGRIWNESYYIQQDMNDVGGVSNKRAVLTNFVRDAVSGGAASSWMPSALLGWHMMPANGGYDFTLEEPTTLDGEMVDRIFIPMHFTDPNKPAKEGMGERLYISERDHLFRRIEEISDESDQGGGINVMTHTFTNIRINPEIPDSTFQFTPAPASQPVASFESLRRRR